MPPRAVPMNILYMESAADFAQGTQTARRVASPVPTMASRNALTLELPTALIAGWTDLEAAMKEAFALDGVRQASEAGFTCLETGRGFPMDMAALGPVLDLYGMSVCGGWFSGQLPEGDIEVDKDRIAQQMAVFISSMIQLLS